MVLVTSWQVEVVLVLSRLLAVLLVIVSLGVGLLLSVRPVPIIMSWLLLVLNIQESSLQPCVAKGIGFVIRVRVPGSS